MEPSFSSQLILDGLEPDISPDIDDAIREGGISMRIDARQLSSDLVGKTLGAIAAVRNRHIRIQADLRKHIGETGLARNNVTRPPEAVTAANEIVDGKTIIP